MPRLAVAYDTNLYRQISSTAFSERVRVERSLGVIAYATYAGALEMAARLQDPNPREAGAALASLKKLVEHAKEFDGRTNVMRWVASPIQQLSIHLFGKPLDGDETATDYAEFVGRLATEAEAASELSPLIADVTAAANDRRQKYRDQLWLSVVEGLVPGARNWSDIMAPSAEREQLLAGALAREGIPLIASGMVDEVARAAGVLLSAADRELAIHHVLRSFRWIVEYRNLVFERLITSGANFDVRARMNGIFDLQFCGATSPIAMLRRVPVVAVTDDGDLLEAARRANMGARVLSAREYAKLLAGGEKAIDEHCRRLRTEGEASVHEV
jgi:hypothetical protein